MTWDMGQGYIRVVTHPSVPIAAADAAGFDLDDGCVLVWDRNRDLLDRDGSLETLEDRSSHDR